MELLEKYLNKIEFDNYDDFKQNLKINIPENFDFARKTLAFFVGL